MELFSLQVYILDVISYFQYAAQVLHYLTPECLSHTRLTKQDIIFIRAATSADH